MSEMPPAPQYAAPPKKSNLVRNILIAVIAFLVLCGGGCLATTVLFAKGVDDAVKEIEAEDKKPGGPDNPLEIQAGKAFEVDGFNYAAGWSISQELDMIELKGLKVTNNRDDADAAIVEIKFWNGTEVLATADCTSEEIDPGTTVTLDCFSADKLPAKYSKVTINDTF